MAIEKQGVFTMSTTPFKRNGDIDYPAFRRHLQYQAAADIGVYLLSFGSGEGHQVDHSEMLKIYEFGAKTLKGTVPVYAAGQGLGPSTRDFIKLAKEIAQTGVDAIQLHSPRPAYPGASAKPAEVERYYIDVLEAVRHPFVLSVHQGAVPGVEPPPALLRRLVDTYPHLIGFNVAHPNLSYIHRVIQAMDNKAGVRIGGSAQALDCLALGGHGFLIYETNLFPKFCASIFADWKAGKANRAGEKWEKLQRLFFILNKHRNPQSIKAAMDSLGLPGGFVRRPYLELDQAARDEIAGVIRASGLAEAEGLTKKSAAKSSKR
ncbi:MAG: dihydrodipicolinate synthase family protein [Dehalococcoidia bacterium]|nr:dihydrodipicolinate synthase family protein [Dehalococcoidia bacterium]